MSEMEDKPIIDCDHYSEKDHPVYWNPYNKVVQCHKCGEIFDSIRQAKIEALESEAVQGLVKHFKELVTFDEENGWIDTIGYKKFKDFDNYLKEIKGE